MKEKSYPRDLDTDGLTQRLETSFRDQGYNVQTLQDKNQDIFVQIKKGGTGRKIVGMDQALTVRIHKDGIANVAVGQAAWASKTAVEVIGLVAFFPLVVTGGYGLYQQGRLPGKVWRVIDDFASSKNVRPTKEEGADDIQCPNCGVTNSAAAEFCNACGEKLRA